MPSAMRMPIVGKAECRHHLAIQHRLGGSVRKGSFIAVPTHQFPMLHAGCNAACHCTTFAAHTRCNPAMATATERTGAQSRTMAQD